MKKEKGVALGSTASSRSYDEFEYKEEEKLNIPAVRFSTRNASSKYDFVKVKVWLGDNADHYYVLSRFLLSRMLTVTKIPNHVALKIALELKKLLIDNSLLDVSQFDLEANLFKLMERRGYGEEYINRYKMMTRFHHQRVPLVILVCGTACVGKSTIATQLAQRLNLPNVLQTGMVYELLRTSTDAPLASSPVWARHFSTPEELITEFCRECRIVRKGLAGDLKKAMKDGKPIIIEDKKAVMRTHGKQDINAVVPALCHPKISKGMHLDPSIYLMDDENKTPTNVSAKLDEQRFAEAVEQNATQAANDSITPSSYNHHSPADELNMVIDGLQSVDIAESARDDKGESTNDSGADRNPLVKKEKSSGAAAAPIIVPIVLKMAEFDHKALLEEWISTRSFSDNYPLQDKDKLISNLKTIQDYLCSFTSQGLTVANISATTFPQTLDWLHSYLLQCIEQGGTSSVSGESVKVTPQKQSTG